MQEFLRKNRIDILILPIVGVFALGIYVGFHNQTETVKDIVVSGKETAVETTADFSPFWKVWSAIDEKSPNADKATDQERVYGAISGLVDTLDDPYTVFFDPEETKIFEADIAGNFSGVGMEVGIKNKVLTIVAPLKDTPAYKAGLKSGDKIIKIDETSTTDLGVERAIQLIRGEKGTTVTLTILRTDVKEPIEVKIVRDIIKIPTLETEMREDGVFVISLFSFSADSTSLFRDAIKEFSNAKTDKLILDLRGNPGGYLDAAVTISSWFLPKGKTVVIEDYGDKEEEKIFRSKGYDVFTDKLKFVILIDGGSASASEIVAGVMQDYGKALLVGEQSYGKGSVQEVVDVTADTILKVTIANWLTPNGNLIAGKGLTPDYEVPFTKADSDADKDPQMDKAVELLNNWPGVTAKTPAVN